jgi:glycosyltransferase involved in cell wall biosynthesis
VPELLVFIPAWNEERDLPRVLDEIHRELPDADVLVVDDGSTDGTAEIARRAGAEVLSFGENRGLASGIAAGYSWGESRGYEIVGRVDADGQHPVAELRRLIDEVRSGRCDVAVGSRFVHGEGYAAYRYRLHGARRFGTALMRRVMHVVLSRPFGDPMSGMYAVNRRAMKLLSEPFTSEAPEVEALMRVTSEGLRLCEVPVDMRLREGGESKLVGRKAFAVVVTIVATLWAGRRMLLRRR